MAQSWPPKAPTEIVERRWSVPVDDGDGLASFARSASGVTIDSYSVEGDEAVLVLSAGSAGMPASVTLTATTSRGKVLVETFYLPIQATTDPFGYTARDLCSFALRKIVGSGEDADAVELADCLERLNDMLAAWKAQGADAGVFLPVLASTVINCPPEFASALKYNLRLLTHEHYGEPLSAFDAMQATRGLQLVKSARLSEDRAQAVYY